MEKREGSDITDIRQWIGGVVTIMLMVTMVSAEPSVYGRSYGGDVQADKNRKMIYSLRQKVNRLEEEIEGLRSVVEGLNQQLVRLRRQKGSQTQGVTSEEFRKLERRIAELEKRPMKIQKDSERKKSGIGKASSGKKTDVTTAKKKKVLNTVKHSAKTISQDPLTRAASNKLFSRGVRLINQKRYAEAKRRFDILEKRNYKPASTQFYLGEIAYRTGRYDDAVMHYQKSAERNENAAYMDRLLLHTAISLEKSGDREQARNFFQAIVDGYPGTSSAAVAKKHLK